MTTTQSQAPTIDANADPFGYRCSIEWTDDPELQAPFRGNFDRYLSYRKELRDEKPDAGKCLPVEARVRTSWNLNPNLRDEFKGSYASCLAYFKAKEEGRVGFTKSGVTDGGRGRA